MSNMPQPDLGDRQLSARKEAAISILFSATAKRHNEMFAGQREEDIVEHHKHDFCTASFCEQSQVNFMTLFDGYVSCDQKRSNTDTVALAYSRSNAHLALSLVAYLDGGTFRDLNSSSRQFCFLSYQSRHINPFGDKSTPIVLPVICLPFRVRER